MGKANVINTNFTTGEISQLMRGRVDLQKYVNGARQIRNLVVRPQGPVWRRGGTQYVGSTLENQPAILVPFVVSSTLFYLLEFNTISLVGRIAVRDSAGNPVVQGSVASILSAVSDAGGTKFTTAAVHGLVAGELVLITASSVAAYNGFWRVLSAASATEFTVNVVFSSTATGSAQKGVNATGGPPWSAGALDELAFAQSADTMWITHKDYKTRKLVRASATSWTLSEFTTVDGPYLDYDKNDTRLTVSNIVDVATLLGNAALVAANPFAAGDVNKQIEYFDDGEWYMATIKTFVSTSEVTADIADNVLVAVHPATRLGPPTSDGALAASRQRIWDLRSLYGRPQRTTPGISPKNSPVVSPREGIDRAVSLTLGATLVASHGQTFEHSDVGKFVRVATGTGGGGADAWRKINAFTNSYTVGIAGVLTWKTYSYASAEYVTLKQASRSITATLKASASTFVIGRDEGRHIRMNFQERWVYAKITSVTSGTEAAIQLFESFPRHLRDGSKIANDGNTDIWRFGAWYGPDATGNYPAQVTFHEQRLVFASSPLEPQTLWFSRPQDFDKMSPSEPDGSVLEDNAINVTMAATEVNKISWLKSTSVLMIGTMQGEWQARAATSINEPIAPANIAITPQTTHGVLDDSPALRIGAGLIFLQRKGLKLYEISYSFELDAWVSRDLTILSEHILRQGSGAVHLTHDREPHSIIWVQLTNGDLAGCTYVREQDVYAWHYHTIGGSGIIESLEAANNGTDYRLFMVVKRTINGSTKRYIELLSLDQYPASASDKPDMKYVDSAKTYSGASTTTPTGFDHLEGATVQVLADGVYVGTKVVSAGTFTLSVAATKVTAGFSYNSDLEPNLLEGGSPYGTAQGKMQRPNRVQIQFYNTIDFKIGRDASNLSPVHTLNAGDFYTGYYSAQINNGYSRDGSFLIRQDQPHPLIILNVMPEQHVNE